ncbi:MAG: diacylglycerol kinase family lipid kinase [Rikenellaceae bacterium]|nr:diacylglycerol kinase family lipid kinase [Rikenellaceae bacterium]
MAVEGKWFTIVNPVAGQGRALDDLPIISRLLREYKIDCEMVFTERKHHATQLTVEAVRAGYRRVIVVGGDGTLHDVINGIFIQKEVPTTEVQVAVIAVGTGNDWIRMFGIPRKYSEAIRAIAENHTFLQDVGEVSYEESSYRQSRYMPNVGGAGLDAAVIRGFDSLKARGHRGRILYVLSLIATFFGYRSTGMRIWVDDEQVVNDLVLSTSVGIGKYSGGGMMQTPEAVADDGLFDLTVISKIKWWQVPKALKCLFNGGIYSLPQVHLYRGAKIRIESSPEVPIEIDGEQLGTTPVEYKIIHRAVRVVVSERFLQGDLQRHPRPRSRYGVLS